MALNYVTLILDLYDGQGNPAGTGTAALVPSAQLRAAAEGMFITRSPVPAVFTPAAFPQVRLLATDNSDLSPSSWTWGITFSGVPGSPPAVSFPLPFTGGPAQYLSAVLP